MFLLFKDWPVLDAPLLNKLITILFGRSVTSNLGGTLSVKHQKNATRGANFAVLARGLSWRIYTSVTV